MSFPSAYFSQLLLIQNGQGCALAGMTLGLTKSSGTFSQSWEEPSSPASTSIESCPKEQAWDLYHQDWRLRHQLMWLLFFSSASVRINTGLLRKVVSFNKCIHTKYSTIVDAVVKDIHCGLHLCAPHSILRFETCNTVMAIGGGAFGKWLNHEGGALVGGISALLKEAPKDRCTLFLPCEDMVRKCHLWVMTFHLPVPLSPII